MVLTLCSDPNDLCNKLSLVLAKTISEKLKPSMSQLFRNANADKHMSLDLSKLASCVFPELNGDPVDFVFEYDKEFVSKVNSNLKKIGSLQDDIQQLRNKLRACSKKGENTRRDQTKLKDTLSYVEDEINKNRNEGLLVSTPSASTESISTTNDAVLAYCISNEQKIIELEQAAALSSNQLKEASARVADLKEQISKYSSKTREDIDDLSYLIDAINQYGRRNILIIEGMRWLMGEDTNKIVIRLFRAMGINIGLRDLDRSHRLYRRGNRSKPPPIYVKFVSHDLKQLIYNQRDMFRQMSGFKSIFINENLTFTRTKLFQKVRKMPLWHSWTNDGKIYLSLKSNPNVIEVIENENDLILFYEVYS